MRNMNKILAVSLIAVAAVSSANAKIVSETLLTATPGTYTSTNTVQAAIADAKKAGTDAAALAVGKVGSVTTGSANGTISVDSTDVAVKGLKSAAYTESSAYATSAQGTKADSAIQSVKVNSTALTPDSSKAVNITVPTSASDIGAATSAQGTKADSAIQSVKVNSTALTPDSNKAVNITVAQGGANGTIAVNGSDVAVKGLGSAAYTASSAYLASQDLVQQGEGDDISSAVLGAKTDDDAILSGKATAMMITNMTNSQYGERVGTAEQNIEALQDTAVKHTKNTAAGSSTLPVYVASNGTATAITSLPFNKISSTPTTLAGYGITDAATSAQGTKADSAIQSVKVNGTALTADSSKAVNVTVPTSASDIGAATSAQGTKADSAIQSVKVNGTALTADSSKAVNVTVAQGSTNGTIAVNGSDVAVKGLGSAAYTASSAYATAAQGTLASNAVPNTRKVNSKALSSDVTLNGADIALTGYTAPTSASAISATSTVNGAIGSLAVGKADKATTLAGYGITDAATSSQGTKADSAIQSVKVNGTALTADSSKAVNVTVAQGSTNGTIAVNGSDVAVKGLGSAAYTASSAYATSGQGTKADSAIQSVKVNSTALTPDSNKAVNITITQGGSNGTIAVNGTNVSVTGLGSAAYTASTAYLSSQDLVQQGGGSDIHEDVVGAMTDDDAVLSGKATTKLITHVMNDQYGQRVGTAEQNIETLQDTAVKHTKSTAAGSASVPVYVAANGTATAITSYSGVSGGAKSVPTSEPTGIPSGYAAIWIE